MEASPVQLFIDRWHGHSRIRTDLRVKLLYSRDPQAATRYALCYGFITVYYRLIYSSLETAPFTKARLEELLRKSRRANLASEITGLLLYQDGHFMQLIEGSKADVLSLFGKIKDDPRHRDVVVLMEAETPSRDFKDWSMGFKTLNSKTSREVPGYKDFEHLTLNQFLGNPLKSLGLLLAFKNSKL